MIRCVLLSRSRQFINQFQMYDVFKFPSPAQLSLCAGNEPDLISYMYNSPTDIVFLELEPPFSMCMTLITTLRQICPEAKIIVISDNRDFDIAINAIRNGASDFLVKPISPQCLSDLMLRFRASVPGFNLNPRIIMPIEYTQALNYLKNVSDEFLGFVEKLFIRAELCREVKLYEMQIGFIEFFHALVKDCEDAFPYFKKYLSHKDFSSISETAYINSETLGSDLSLLAGRLFALVKLFVPPSKNNLIKNVTNYILENVEMPLSLESIADSFYVNKTYLSHLFKVEHGISFVKYYTEVRMQRSRVLLLEDRKIYECAMLLHYEDAEYFSKTFKQRFGCRPSEYSSVQSTTSLL
ncbi:MAG: helix-turn-helix domain-containing protein [Lachnospiraceae bacterium]|nr:helix-turn-helix domain-containing protein [Lachnospiraceae bacterium]